MQVDVTHTGSSGAAIFRIKGLYPNKTILLSPHGASELRDLLSEQLYLEGVDP